jgi:hypothetical protein
MVFMFGLPAFIIFTEVVSVVFDYFHVLFYCTLVGCKSINVVEEQVEEEREADRNCCVDDGV